MPLSLNLALFLGHSEAIRKRGSEMILDAFKTWLWRGRLVAVDTNFAVSASYVESCVRQTGVKNWGWSLRDGVVMFYVPEVDAQFIKNKLLGYKLITIVV